MIVIIICVLNKFFIKDDDVYDLALMASLIDGLILWFLLFELIF